ncbi:MAG: hypothetical protein HYY49_02640 [Ignavibacteriales bacterium]|nr:hypothetical protein [Ignavibacteriales bacterium]
METRPFRASAQLFIGLLVIFFGVILTLDNFDLLEAREYLRFWPAFIVAFGLVKATQSRRGAGRNAGLLIAAVGFLLLLGNIRILDIGFRDLWPLLLVIFGGSLIWRASARYRTPAPTDSSTDTDSSINLFAFMGGFERTITSKNFQGGEMTAIMGGCEVDLRQSSIKDVEAVIDVFAFWGGVSLKVPEDWTVSVQGLPIMGGIEDKSHPPKSETAKRLVVKGYAIMGGVEISN